MPTSYGYPNLDKSKNVIGFNTYNHNYYIHLGDKHKTYLTFTTDKPTLPYIVETNGFINKVNKTSNKTNFELTSYITPINLTLANVSRCKIYDGEKRIKRKNASTQFDNFEFNQGKKHEVSIVCRN